MAAGQTLLLTGATGSLGRSLRAGLADRFNVVATASASAAAGMASVDLSDAQAAAALVAGCRPDIVVHAAALTDVDRCERERRLAWRINVEATGNLVAAVKRHAPAARFVYISTDQVYAGPGPSAENQAAPQTIYALTKKWGEDLVLALGGALVLRLNFVAPGRPGRVGLADWLMDSLAGQKPITLFDDALFNPIHADDLADILVSLLDGGRAGVLNIGARQGLSKADFARELARRAGLSLVTARLGRLAEAGLSADRPLDTRMDVSRAEQALGRSLPAIDAVLDRTAQGWLARHPN